MQSGVCSEGGQESEGNGQRGASSATGPDLRFQ